MVNASPKRFTVDDYHRLAQLGFFTEDDRVELIRGQIIQMAEKGTAHEVCLTRLLKQLVSLLLNELVIVRCQSPIALLRDSEPEPDFAIVHHREDEYLSSHPNAADVLLVIEISDSSFSYDRDIKLPLYAEAGIFDYWLFNLVESCLETYSEPYQDANGHFGYRMKRIVLPNEAIALPNTSNSPLQLSNIFPNRTT